MKSQITSALSRRGAALGDRLSRASYLQRWVSLGLAIGLIAGGGAVLFYWVLSEATHLLTGGVAGYHPPRPAGEGGGSGDGARFSRWWAVPLVVAAGGLASGMLVFRLAPEAEGHGTDAAINAVHRDPRSIRMRAVLVKLVASAITIGSGGSGGREGPTAQISAGFGSLLARWLHLTDADGRIAVSVGIGSGIGAIFGAPLGGAVMAADIVYRDDFDAAALAPGLIASITSYSVFGATFGFHPLFGNIAYQFNDPRQLVWFAIIGGLCGLVGLAYSRTFYGAISVTQRLPGSRVIKPAVGGLLVGLIALAVPQALGTGYGWIQAAFTRQTLLHLSLWIVLALPLVKILTTSLSIGTGGSGGIFGPGMLIGAFTGAAVWRLAEPLGWAVPHQPAAFVAVGMTACFGAIARAPLSMILMVAEMTDNIGVIAPAMVAVGIAFLVVRHVDDTIYRSQPRDRVDVLSPHASSPAGSTSGSPDGNRPARSAIRQR